MNRYFFLLLFFTSSRLAISQDAYQVQDYQVKFFIKNAGFTVEGSMSGLEADVQFHSRKPNKSSIKATLDPSTIQTGIKIRDNHLKRSDYFDVEQHPKIYLKSIDFSSSGSDKLVGTFELTIKDTPQKIEIPIIYIRQDGTLQLSGTFTLDRQDFGLGNNSIILSDNVEVQLNASLERIPQ